MGRQGVKLSTWEFDQHRPEVPVVQCKWKPQVSFRFNYLCNYLCPDSGRPRISKKGGCFCLSSSASYQQLWYANYMKQICLKNWEAHQRLIMDAAHEPLYKQDIRLWYAPGSMPATREQGHAICNFKNGYLVSKSEQAWKGQMLSDCFWVLDPFVW